MTTTLREEIKNHVKEILADQHCDWAADIDINKYTNSILIKFEKRIDLFFRILLEHISKDMTKEQMNYIESIFLTVFERQKKELLK